MAKVLSDEAMSVDQWGAVPDTLGALSELAQSASDPEPPLPPDELMARLPEVLRIQSLERTLTPEGRIHNRAVLYHRHCSLRVDWLTQHSDIRLHRHGLVRLRHAKRIESTDGSVRIERLLPTDRADATTNLFDTVPNEWVRDRELVAQGAALWETLPRPLAHLFNAVFWEDSRFHRYVMGPSSLSGHHNGINGNLRHSVDVAQTALELASRSSLADPTLLILAALLHDAGKADDYVYDRIAKRFRLSPRGELVGHRDTLIEWIAVSRHEAKVPIAESTYLALLHALNAAKGAPPWLGLREPRCIEAEILSAADRLSGNEDLHRRCAPHDGTMGFGNRHPHIKYRTYVTGRAA
jgi:3'-5' exoribonuclease